MDHLGGFGKIHKVLVRGKQKDHKHREVMMANGVMHAEDLGSNYGPRNASG